MGRFQLIRCQSWLIPGQSRWNSGNHCVPIPVQDPRSISTDPRSMEHLAPLPYPGEGNPLAMIPYLCPSPKDFGSLFFPFFAASFYRIFWCPGLEFRGTRKQKHKTVWSVKNMRKFDLKLVKISLDSLKVDRFL